MEEVFIYVLKLNALKKQKNCYNLKRVSAVVLKFKDKLPKLC